MSTTNEKTYDEYDQYNMEQDKFMKTKGGKGRSKCEAAINGEHHDPSGHTRKIVTKLHNAEAHKKVAGK